MTVLKVKPGRWFDHAVEISFSQWPEREGKVIATAVMACGQLPDYAITGEHVEHMVAKMVDWTFSNDKACPICKAVLTERMTASLADE